MNAFDPRVWDSFFDAMKFTMSGRNYVSLFLLWTSFGSVCHFQRFAELFFLSEHDGLDNTERTCSIHPASVERKEANDFGMNPKKGEMRKMGRLSVSMTSSPLGNWKSFLHKKLSSKAPWEGELRTAGLDERAHIFPFPSSSSRQETN